MKAIEVFCIDQRLILSLYDLSNPGYDTEVEWLNNRSYVVEKTAKTSVRRSSGSTYDFSRLRKRKSTTTRRLRPVSFKSGVI